LFVWLAGWLAEFILVSTPFFSISAEIALHFPRINTSDYVVIEKPFARNLTALTISMWLKMANTSLSHPGHKHTPISYALNDNLSNEMMFRFYTYKVVVYINSAGT